MQSLGLINVPINLGCNKFGVEEAGDFLRKNGLYDIFKGDYFVDLGDIDCKPLGGMDSRQPFDMKNINEILYSCSLLADKVYSTLEAGVFPLIFGGDHSLSWGSINGVVRKHGRIRVVYIDAHGDFNTRETSVTGNVHGMHMAYLMGYGEERFVDFYSRGHKLNHEDVFFLGTRSLDAGEVELADNNGFHIKTTEYIKENGVKRTCDDLLACIENRGLEHLHISLDIDSLDPVIAPGTGVPEENGLCYDEVESILKSVFSTGKVVSIDLVEFNHRLDKHGMTFDLVRKFLNVIKENYRI